MTADHWGFVVAAYGLAAVVLTAYWRHLCRRDRDLAALIEAKIARREKKRAQ